MPIITFDKRSFLKGQSTYKFMSDGGFAPESVCEVLRKDSTLGLLSFGRTATEYQTGLAGVVVATGVSYRSGLKYYSICTNGKLYETVPFPTISHTLKYTEAVKTYTAGISDVKPFNDKIYITSTTDIYRENYSFSENDADYWTATLGKTALTATVPHLLFEFQSLQYVTNGNKIWSHDGTTGYDSSDAINNLTLPTDWIVNKVLVDDNEIYLFAYFKGNSGALYNTPFKIFVWDGYSSRWTRTISLNTKIVNGVVNTAFGKFFSTIDYLYRFDGYNYVPEKYSSSSIEGILASEDDIFIYGGTSLYKYNIPYKSLSKIGSVGNSIISIQLAYSDSIQAFVTGASVSTFYEFLNNTALTSIYTNYYEFEEPVSITGVEVMFGATTIAGTSYNLLILNEIDTTLQTISIADVGIIKFKKKVVKNNLNAFKIQLTSANAANKPIRWIKVYWQPSQLNTKK